MRASIRRSDGLYSVVGINVCLAVKECDTGQFRRVDRLVPQSADAFFLWGRGAGFCLLWIRNRMAGVPPAADTQKNEGGGCGGCHYDNPPRETDFRQKIKK